MWTAPSGRPRERAREPVAAVAVGAVVDRAHVGEVALGGPVGERVVGRAPRRGLGQVGRHRLRRRRRARGRLRSSSAAVSRVAVVHPDRPLGADLVVGGRDLVVRGRERLGALVDDRVDDRALRRRRARAPRPRPSRSSVRAPSEPAPTRRYQCSIEACSVVPHAQLTRRAGGAQLVERALGVARLDVDAADPGAVDRDPEALAQGVGGGLLDAVVGGQADDRDLVDVPRRAGSRLEVRSPRSRSSPRGRGS